MKYLKLYEELDIDFDDWEWEEDEPVDNKRIIRRKGENLVPEEKDFMRIRVLVQKYGRNTPDAIRAARTMAKRITHLDKAYRRATAADELGYESLGKVFWDRVYDLYDNRPIREEIDFDDFDYIEDEPLNETFPIDIKYLTFEEWRNTLEIDDRVIVSFDNCREKLHGVVIDKLLFPPHYRNLVQRKVIL